jgi:hypothetical protein
MQGNSNNSPCDITDIYNKICASWCAYDSFWRVGNAFTTLIDYFVMKGKGDSGIINYACQMFDNNRAGSYWYDDYSWWGVAFLQAWKYHSVLGIDPQKCLDNAKFCWDKMHDKGTTVWDRAEKPYFDEAQPRFAGGCWNNDLQRGGCDPLEPGTDPYFCGIQNTVTNGQYLVLSARFYRQSRDRTYLDAALQLYHWFQQWYSDPNLTPEQNLLARFPDGKVLIRERVSTYAFWKQGYPPVRYYRPNFHWAGDQGIILGAMVDLAQIDPTRATIYQAFGRAILDGVREHMTDAQDILPPWIPDDSLGAYNDDYSTGIGVFMRYLLYAFRTDPVLSAYISGTYKSFVMANANKVCKEVAGCSYSGYPMNEMECLINQLAVLNAETAIMSGSFAFPAPAASGGRTGPTV